MRLDLFKAFVSIIWKPINRFTMQASFYMMGILTFRSSRPEVFYKKGVLRNFAKFTGKHLCQSLFFNKVAGPRPKACNFIKNETPEQAPSKMLLFRFSKGNKILGTNLGIVFFLISNMNLAFSLSLVNNK